MKKSNLGITRIIDWTTDRHLHRATGPINDDSESLWSAGNNRLYERSVPLFGNV